MTAQFLFPLGSDSEVAIKVLATGGRVTVVRVAADVLYKYYPLFSYRPAPPVKYRIRYISLMVCAWAFKCECRALEWQYDGLVGLVDSGFEEAAVKEAYGGPLHGPFPGTQT